MQDAATNRKAVKVWQDTTQRESYRKVELSNLLLTQQEAAALLAVSTTTVWRMYRAGKLATCRIGGRTLITSQSVREYVESNTEVSR